MARVLVFDNTKGGVGKTTFAVHFAVLLHDMGFRVAVIDADRQRLARKCLSTAEPAIAVRRTDTPGQVAKELKALRSSCDFVIADGPKGDDNVSLALLLSADALLVPLMPSGFDLWSTIENAGDLLERVQTQRRERGKPRLKAYAVLNGIDKRTTVFRELVKLLPLLEHRGIPAVTTRVCRSQSFINATFKRTVVFRMKGTSLHAKRDMQQLFLETMVEKFRFVDRRSMKRATALLTAEQGR